MRIARWIDGMTDVRAKMVPLGYDLSYADGRSFAARIAADYVRCGEVIRQAGITPD